MYVENVRKALGDLDDEEFDIFVIKLKQVFFERFEKSIKKSILENRVYNFVNRKITPNLETFEAFLLTFDNMAMNGGIKALTNEAIRYPNTWRSLLLRITEDRPLPEDITKQLEDKDVSRQLKVCFYNTIGYCRSSDKDKFYNNLLYFSQFLSISV